MAITKRILIKPPRVKDVKMPRSHRTINITAIVVNIYLFELIVKI